MQFINREGQTIMGIKILKELGHGKVSGQCLQCGGIREYPKKQVVRGMKSCGCLGRIKINIEGKKFGHMVVTKELGKGRVEAMCIDCKHKYQYNKNSIRINGATCRNKECKNYIDKHMINRVGEVYNKIKIVKELGNNKVLTECMECGYKCEFNKALLIKGVSKCKNPECSRHHIIVDRVGEEVNGMVIVEELYGRKIRAMCKTCGAVAVFPKGGFIMGNYRCKNPECNNKRRSHLVDRVGEVHNNLKIVKELRYSRVEAECMKCGYIGKYNKVSVVAKTALCINCGVRSQVTYRRIEGHKINRLVVNKYLYKGIDDKLYYECTCNVCGETEIILDYDSIFKYECNNKA